MGISFYFILGSVMGNLHHSILERVMGPYTTYPTLAENLVYPR